VKASPEHPALFTAVTIVDALDSFKAARLEEAEFIKGKKDELLSRWRTMTEKNSTK